MRKSLRNAFVLAAFIAGPVTSQEGVEPEPVDDDTRMHVNFVTEEVERELALVGILLELDEDVAPTLLKMMKDPIRESAATTLRTEDQRLGSLTGLLAPSLQEALYRGLRDRVGQASADLYREDAAKRRSLWMTTERDALVSALDRTLALNAEQIAQVRSIIDEAWSDDWVEDALDRDVMFDSDDPLDGFPRDAIEAVLTDDQQAAFEFYSGVKRRWSRAVKLSGKDKLEAWLRSVREDCGHVALLRTNEVESLCSLTEEQLHRLRLVCKRCVLEIMEIKEKAQGAALADEANYERMDVLNDLTALPKDILPRRAPWKKYVERILDENQHRIYTRRQEERANLEHRSTIHRLILSMGTKLSFTAQQQQDVIRMALSLTEPRVGPYEAMRQVTEIPVVKFEDYLTQEQLDSMARINETVKSVFPDRKQ